MNLNDKLNTTFEWEHKYSGLFGVELELEGLNLPRAVSGWMRHEEGSLRGEAVELVTNGACTTKELEAKLDSLTAQCKALQTVVVKSPRASTHIHLNVQNENYRTILNLGVLFSAIEPLFLVLCGETRNGNNFCLPSYDSGDMHIYYEDIKEAYQRGRLAGLWVERGKYGSISFDPINRFGSIEFRCFPTTVDKNEILEWTWWLQRLLDMARSFLDEKELHRLIVLSRSNPDILINTIFPSLKHNRKHAEDLVKHGCEYAYEVSRIYRTFGEGSVKKEKKIRVAPPAIPRW